MVQLFEWFSLEKLLLYLAVPASAILVLQTVLTVLGIGEDMDIDSDGIGDADEVNGSSLTIFSLRNLIAFFTFFGWGGLWLMNFDLDPIVIIILGAFIGCVFVAISMSMFYFIAKMQRSGTLVMANAVGLKGEVYIPIPAKGTGTGKLMLRFQGSLRELEAKTFDVSKIKTGEQVHVVSVEGDILIVTRMEDEVQWSQLQEHKED